MPLLMERDLVLNCLELPYRIGSLALNNKRELEATHLIRALDVALDTLRKQVATRDPLHWRGQPTV